MLTILTTADDVIGTFNVTPPAQRLYHGWITDETRTEVVEHVTAHCAEVVYEADPDAVMQICRSTEHALGDVQKKEITQVKAIENWSPAFAFSHVLHYSVEREGRLLTWEEFFQFIQDDPKAQGMLWLPSLEAIHRLSSDDDPISVHLAKSAVRWRVGNAYYSFLRELFAVSHWRAMGLDVQVHPLADALFRVDAWYGRTVIALYVGNPKYRDDHHGRKRDPRRLLAEARPPFRFVTVRLPAATRYGEVLLPTIEQVRNAALVIEPRLNHLENR